MSPRRSPPYPSGVHETRLLTRTGAPPYTEYPIRALPLEPEAVPRDDQERQTLAVHRAERDRRRKELDPLRDEVLDKARLLFAQYRARSSDVRVLERVIARLDRSLG
jgi:hypothetical protein